MHRGLLCTQAPHSRLTHGHVRSPSWGRGRGPGPRVLRASTYRMGSMAGMPAVLRAPWPSSEAFPKVLGVRGTMEVLQRHCVTVVGRLQPRATHWVPQNHRNVFSSCSGGQKSGIGMPAGPNTLRQLQGRVLPPSSSFWGCRCPRACGHVPPASPSCSRDPSSECLCVLFLLLTGTLFTRFRAHLGG